MLNIALILSVAGGAIVASAFVFFCCFPMLGILQQENYGGKAFIKWYFKKNNMLPRRIELFTLSLVLLVTLFDLCFSFAGTVYANLISALPFIGMCALYLFSGQKYALKVPVKRTGRLMRLGVCGYLLTAAVFFGVCIGGAAIASAADLHAISLLRFVPVCLLPLIMPFVFVAANFIMKGYELPRNRRFLRKAKKALSASACVKVGITGSCGKTSVKQMAAAILGEKMRALATPSSYNTPIGIARTVNEHGLDCDVFLAEMGAKHTGDIAELCDLVQPAFGVITAVLPQHLETFGSVQAIAAEKGVLASRAQKCVIGKSAAEAGIRAEGALVWGEHFAAEEVVCTCEGTQFLLRLPDGSVGVKTALLGRHAAEDIALAAALCHLLGMSKEEIASGITAIQPIPNRLQKIEGNGLHILDDSYNSNIQGAQNAVETLRLFPGKKAVITPGLVELGVLEGEANEALGASLVGLDAVILVGETLVLSVRKGYLEAGGEEEKLHLASTLEKATELLSQTLTAGDSVLFLNDLPDVYL